MRSSTCVAMAVALTEAVSLSGLFIPAGPRYQYAITTARCVKQPDTSGQVLSEGRWWYWLTVSVLRLQKSCRGNADYGRALVVGEPTFGKGAVSAIPFIEPYLRSDATS
ncbi:hypothetical protein ACLK19_12380 [Escherichia coli]